MVKKSEPVEIGGVRYILESHHIEETVELAGKLAKLAEAASGVWSPCDLETEKERGFCMGHGGCRRLPCEFGELREALDALKRGVEFKDALAKVNAQYGETFKRLAQQACPGCDGTPHAGECETR